MKRLSPGNTLQAFLPNNPILTRCFTILGITLLLLLPLSFFLDLVDERSDLHTEAVANIAGLWGGTQVVRGPVLVIPYVDRHMYDSGQTASADRKGAKSGTQYLVVLPKTLNFSASLTTERRYRGIYDYVVYTAPVAVEGSFRLPEDGPLSEYRNQPLWDQAFFLLSVTDLKAITSIGALTWNGKGAGSFSPGAQTASLLDSGFHAKVAIAADQPEYTFSMDMNLNGSGGLYFTPVGETTTIKIAGNWADPSFGGQLLPSKRSISESGFSAEWNVPHLSRTYPQSGNLSAYMVAGDHGDNIRNFVAGVGLQELLPLYRLVTRAVKYAILFIGLTFVALFSFELVCRERLHLIQYGLVGVAMCLFYLVLLSLAEHTAFGLAFAAASTVTVVMNGLYIRSAMRSRKKGLLIAALVAGLYGVLYALLQLEGYAILMGTVLVVIAVCALMYMTRNLRAGNGGKEDADPEPDDDGRSNNRQVEGYPQDDPAPALM